MQVFESRTNISPYPLGSFVSICTTVKSIHNFAQNYRDLQKKEGKHVKRFLIPFGVIPQPPLCSVHLFCCFLNSEIRMSLPPCTFGYIGILWSNFLTTFLFAHKCVCFHFGQVELCYDRDRLVLCTVIKVYCQK